MDVNFSSIDLFESIINNAIEVGASDIHIEPDFNELKVRFRIDGILYSKAIIIEEYAIQLISRIKILAGMNVSEKRIPQDGKIIFKSKFKEIDLRIATFPCINGEKIAIRLLDKFNNNLEIDLLGLNSDIEKKIKDIAQSSSGFFLVTGPTGSGKTTTLHAMLNIVNKKEKNIFTLEDPVEYYISQINQSNIHPEIGFTFESGIKALLRQDPDIIMVGEIRDKNTAKVAIQAALTGHLVLSTLHTNNTIGAITRLIDMDIEPFLLNSCLTGVLSQKLIRKLCNNCKYKRKITKEESFLIKKLNINIEFAYESNGCSECLNLGYKGRTGIFELLIINSTIKDLITKKAAYKEIYSHINKDNFISFLQDAYIKIISGITSITEIAKVLF